MRQDQTTPISTLISRHRPRRDRQPTGAETPNQAPRHKTGEVVGGRYEILAIHQGGMGTVYAALDRQMRLPVALKTLQERFLMDHQMRNLFEHEALTWLKLGKHPFIVRAILVEEIEHRTYVIAQYIQGEESVGNNLTAWLGHPRLTLSVALAWALEIALGMRHAQRQIPGLVHQDLKPDNVLVNVRGAAMVTDFGLVRARPGAGTPMYMAPEQWRHEVLDLRTDIYAYGCILYEMVTGHRMFAASSLREWQTAHLERMPVPPRQWMPDLPHSVEDLILRCIAKERNSRPSNWDEILDATSHLFSELTGKQAILDFALPEQTAWELGAAAYSFARLHKWRDALEVCDRALAVTADSGVWNTKGKALGGLGDFDGEIAAYDRALAINPSLTAAWLNKGNAFRRLRRYEEAIAIFDRALAVNPKDASLWDARGGALYEMNEPEKALVSFDSALSIEPDRAITWNNKGLTLSHLQRYEAGIAMFDRGLEIQPDDAAAWYNRGLALFKSKRLEEAISSYERSLGIDPNNADVWYSEGLVLAVLKQFVKAISCYDRALALDPRYANAWIWKAKAFGSLGKPTQALECVDFALKIDPNNSAVWYDKGMLLGGLGRYVEAASWLDRVLALNQDDANAWHGKGLCQGSIGQLAGAIESFDRALSINPNHGGALNARNRHVAEMKRRSLERAPNGSAHGDNEAGPKDLPLEQPVRQQPVFTNDSDQRPELPAQLNHTPSNGLVGFLTRLFRR